MCKTNEESVTSVYKKMCWLLKENTDEIFLSEHGIDAFNYSIEILKKSPKSQESYYAMLIINSYGFKSYLYKIEEIFNSLNKKHYQHIDDPNFEENEKLIYLIIYFHGIGAKSLLEQSERKIKAFEVFKNMQLNCTNRDYAALATTMLFLSNNTNDRLNSIDYFIKNFNDHPAIPAVNLYKIMAIYDFKKISSDSTKINECITVTKNLIEKYGNVNLPHGWTFSIDCYCLLINCYKFINDNENAKRYYNIIKKEAPNYWLLNDLKEMLID